MVTYELQWASDVFAILQSMVEGRYVPRELLTKDLPEEHLNNLDYLIDILDWEKNTDPCFAKNRFKESVPVAESEEENEFSEKWIVYGNELFCAKELRINPRVSLTIKDAAAYGMVIIQGHGKIENLSMESPRIIGFNELAKDDSL